MQRNLPYVDIDLRIVAASRWQRKVNCKLRFKRFALTLTLRLQMQVASKSIVNRFTLVARLAFVSPIDVKVTLAT